MQFVMLSSAKAELKKKAKYQWCFGIIGKELLHVKEKAVFPSAANVVVLMLTPCAREQRARDKGGLGWSR
jgi:hypothetical protein